MRIILASLALLVLICVASGFHPDSRTQQYVGYININQEYDANMFYWFFESQGHPKTDPVIIWLTGGPGCSSELALFFENGPLQVSDHLKLEVNPYSWNIPANLMYIDNPVGVGFSYANEDYVHNETMVGDELYAFIQGWYAQFPHYRSNDLYIFAESYGGHYAPSFSSKIVQENNAGVNEHINLKGVGVGNGWTDPKAQYPQYGPYAYDNGLITAAEYKEINETLGTCLEYLDADNWTLAFETCAGIMGDLQNFTGGINVYNIDGKCDGQLCYNLTAINDFLNEENIQEKLGVAFLGRNWTDCNFQVYGEFIKDWGHGFEQDFPIVLAAGVRVLVYSGMLDLICNYYGGNAWTSQMQWPGQQQFNAQSFADWVYEGETVGHWRTFNNFTFLEVEDAGHMVPHDQPAVALEMLTLFLNNEPFPSA